MELYLDTANIEQIKEVAQMGIISGVTTNPTLLSKEDPSRDFRDLIQEIYQIVGGHLSVEVISTNTEGMIREAEEIIEWFPQATIKIPMLPAGLSAVKELSSRGIPTNVTLVFSATQAIAAHNAGANFVSIFLGRLDDIGYDGIGVLQDVCEIWDVQGYDSLIIAASIRNPLHIIEAARAGADIATIPYNVLMLSLKNPLTDRGLDAFLRDFDKYLTERQKSMLI